VDREERRQFVRDHRLCVFGYGRKEHGPAMTVVYYVTDGDDLLISTMASRSKTKAVDRNGLVSLCILDEEWPLGYLQVYGTAVVSRDRALAIDVLTRVIGIMAGEDVPESRRPQIEQMVDDEHRVVIRVTPYATFETPPRHVYKMSDIDTLTHFTSTSMPW
jgi:PPOX class probable F420-dependent enzyme